MTNLPQKRRWWQPAQRKENPVAGATLSYYGGRAVYSTTNAAAYAQEGYAENPDVRTAIDILATAVGGVEWCAHRTTKAGDEEVADAPILKLLRRPNPTMAGTQFMSELVRWRRIAGEAYIISAGASGRPPMELWIARPDRMRIVPSTNPAAPILRYEYKAGTKTTILDPATVLHLPMFNPTGDLYGLSPLASVAKMIDQAAAAADWNLSTMQNGGIPPGFLTSEAELSDKQFEDLKEDLAGWGRSANAGIPQLLEGGLKWQDAARTPAEMQFLEAQRMFALKFAQVIGVPAEFLSGAGEKKYANFAEAQRALFLLAVLPELDYLADELNAWLAPKFKDGVVLAYDDDDIEALQEDRTAVHTRSIAAFRGGVATRNEARAMLGLEDLPDGDVFVEDTQFGGGMSGAGDTGANVSDPATGTPAKSKAYNLTTPEAKAAYFKRVEANRGRFEAVNAKLIGKVFDGERSRVVKALESGGNAARVVDESKTEFTDALTTIYMTVGKAFALDTIASLKSTSPAYRHAATPSWEAYVQRHIKRVVAGRVVGIVDTTKEQIKRIVAAGHEAGLAPAEIALSIDKLYLEQIIPNRSLTIARTETCGASNAGSLAGARGMQDDLGMELMKEWLPSLDESTRDTHEAMAGEKIPLDESFTVGDDEMDVPGDDAGSAGNVINCRCSVVFENAE